MQLGEETDYGWGKKPSKGYAGTVPSAHTGLQTFAVPTTRVGGPIIHGALGRIPRRVISQSRGWITPRPNADLVPPNKS